MADTIEKPKAQEQKEQQADRFPEAVKAEHEKLKAKEKEPNVLDKAADFTKRGVERVLIEFEEGGLLKKAAIVAGTVGLAALAFSLIKEMAKGVGKAVDSVFETGSWLSEKLGITKLNSTQKILGLILGTGTAGLLYEAIQGKVSFSDISKAYGEKGALGVGALIVEKQASGALNLGKDTWNKIGPALGLPAFESIGKTFEKGMEWLDKELKFTETKENYKKFFKDHGLELSMPDWLPSLSLSEMAKDLGIDQSNVATYVVEGGAAYLMYSWLKHKKMLLGLNAAAYLLLIRDGKKSWGAGIIKDWIAQVQGEQEGMIDKLGDKYPYIRQFVTAAFDSLNVEENIDGLLDWASRHPLEAVGIFNAGWIFKGVIMSTLIKIPIMLGKEAVSSPGRTMAVGAAALLLAKGRRQFVEDLVQHFYGDLKKPEAKQVMETLDKSLFIDRGKESTVLEKQVPRWTYSLLEDPLNAIRIDKTIQEGYKNGAWGLFLDASGKVFYFIRGVGFLPVKAAYHSGTAIYDTITTVFSSESDQGYFLPIATGTGISYMLGSRAIEGFKAYGPVMDTAGEGASKLSRMSRLLWTVTPASKEGRFVARSILTIPGYETIKRTGLHLKVGEAGNKLENLLTLLKKPGENLQKIKNLVSELDEFSAKQFPEFLKLDQGWFQGGFKGNVYEFRAAEQLSGVQAKIKEISSLVSGIEHLSEEEQLRKLTPVLRLTEESKTIVTALNKNWIAKMLSLDFLESGNVKEAMKVAVKFGEDGMDTAKSAAQVIQGGLGKMSGAAEVVGENLGKAKGWMENKQWYQDFKAWRGAKFGVTEIDDLVRLKDEVGVFKYLLKQGVDAEKASGMVDDLVKASKHNEVLDILKNSLGVDQVRFSPKILAGIRALKYMGAGAAILGTTFSAIEMSKAFIDAAVTDDSDRRWISMGKGGMWAGNLVVDSAGTYATIVALKGGTAAGASSFGMLALPAIPVVAVGSNIFDSMYERTITTKEWAELNTSREKAIHEWITSVEELDSAGEKFRYAFTTADVSDIAQEKKETARKILETVLMRDEFVDPNHAPEDYKPDKYRMHYLRVLLGEGASVQTSRMALQLLSQSKLFSDIMHERDLRKEAGQPFLLNGLDVLDKKYDQPGVDEISEMLRALEDYRLSQVPDSLQQKLEKVSVRTLINLYCKARLLQEVRADLIEPDQVELANQIYIFLTHKKDINLSREEALFISALQGKKISDEQYEAMAGELSMNLKSIEENENDILKEDIKPKDQYVDAVYRVAQYFGYTGSPNEESLRAFFREDTAGMYGIYWSGKAWYMNINYGMDAKLGVELDKNTVTEMWKQYDTNSGNIFETRNESLFDVVTFEGRRTMNQQSAGLSRVMREALSNK